MDSTALSRRSLIRMRSRVGRPKPHEVGFFVTPPKFLAGLGAPLDAAINLEVAEEELLHRLAGRGRADDNAQTIRNRLQVFVSSTRPLLDYYDGQGLLFSVAAAGTIDEVSDWYERPWMPPAPTDRLLVVAGELRSTVRPSGTGASGSKRRLGRPVIVRWAASPS